MAKKKAESEKKKRGRKSTYKEEYCDKMIEYFTTPPRDIVYKETYYNDGTVKSKEPIVLPALFPTYQGFANSINTDVDTLLKWAKRFSKFGGAYTRAKQIQEDIWLKNSLGNQYNAQFAKFFGTNCLGYREKQEVDVDGNLDVKIKVID